MDFPWKHSQDDPEPSRHNVLKGGERFPVPPPDFVEIVIPDAALFGLDADPDEGRYYWAEYESPAGELWRTENPARRWGDFAVARVRSRRFRRWQQRQRLEHNARAAEVRWKRASKEAIDAGRRFLEGGKQPPE
jgi:hypothetical protein